MSSFEFKMTETDVASPTSTTSTSPDINHNSTKFHIDNSSNSNAKALDDKMSYRKTTKPMMEKKRRARINHCLAQLKSLVLQAMKKDNSQYSKLEKADILELTVKHLKQVQRLQTNNSTTQMPEAINKYRAGFNECANEVVRYLKEAQGVNGEARSKIISHLTNLLSPVNSLPILPENTAATSRTIFPASTSLCQEQQPQPHQLLTLPLLPNPQQSHLKSDIIIPNSNILIPEFKTQQIAQQQLIHPANFPIGSAFLGHRILSECTQNIPDINNNTPTLSRVDFNNNNHTTVITPERSLISNQNKSSCDIRIKSSSSPNSLDVPSFPNPSTSRQSISLPTQIPCVQTIQQPMTSSMPYQLVQSTLPNGQVALVLAPQTNLQTPTALNLSHPNIPPTQSFTTPKHTSDSSIPRHIISSSLSNTPYDNQEQATVRRNLQNLHIHSRNVTSPQASINEQLISNTSQQDNPISLVMNKPNFARPYLSSPPSAHSRDVPMDNLNVNNHTSAFHQPSSPFQKSPQSYPPPLSSASPSPCSLSSQMSKPKLTQFHQQSVIKCARNSPPPTHVYHDSRFSPESAVYNVKRESPLKRRSASPLNSKLTGSSEADDLGLISSSDPIRSPENVTCARDMIEYKMGKMSRKDSDAGPGGSKPAWRPW